MSIACLSFARATLLLAAAGTAGAAPGRPIALTVDAREANRRVIDVREELPVAPGPLTLVYPKWIPGGHAPIGAVENLTGLRFTADGKPVAWRRDAVDM